jgi:hypothetical protein
LSALVRELSAIYRRRSGEEKGRSERIASARAAHLFTTLQSPHRRSYVQNPVFLSTSDLRITPSLTLARDHMTESTFNSTELNRTPLSFGTQCPHGFDGCSAACGQVARYYGNQSQKQAYSGECERIAGPKAEKLAGN